MGPAERCAAAVLLDAPRIPRAVDLVVACRESPRRGEHDLEHDGRHAMHLPWVFS